MASHNTLLGMGPRQEATPVDSHVGTPMRAWRYHKDCREGRLLTTKEAIEKADAEGWVDNPGKIFRLPGLESVYDEYNKVKPLDISLDNIAGPAPELTAAQIEDAKKADALKAENDRIEAKRLEDEAKAKLPPVQHICEECGKEFEKPQALRMHKMSAHKKAKEG